MKKVAVSVETAAFPFYWFFSRLYGSRPAANSAIISAVGYENTSYFYRRFHAEYRLSPQDYRRQVQQANRDACK